MALPELVREIIDQAVQDITRRMAGIELLRTPAGRPQPGMEVAELSVEMSGDTPFVLLCQLEPGLLVAIAERMKRSTVTGAEEAAEYACEYFNVVCGHVAAGLYYQTQSRPRFGIVRCRRMQSTGQSSCPGQGGSGFGCSEPLCELCFQCEQGAARIWGQRLELIQ